MKFFLFLLTLACICHLISTQDAGDPFPDLGVLDPRVQEKVRNCGQIWITGCILQPTTRPTGRCSCQPSFEFSSEEIQTTRVGHSVTLFCFYSGYPRPQILWTGPQGSRLKERYIKTNFDTTIILNGITSSDVGNYSCLASNTFGQNERTLQIQVVAAPEFQSTTDAPSNVTVTEGETVTFSCNPFAMPGANIVWLQNEEPIDADNLSEKFVISNDDRNLTIRDVRRNYDDRNHQTDLMVIQCNASNVHGYAFAQGYLNVLMKTKVKIRGPREVSVDFLEEKQFVFQCSVTSDPSTPVTVQWYKTEPRGDLVRSEPPYVNVTNEFLIITIGPNCTAQCMRYLGEYICVGDNGYSRDIQTITISYVYTSTSLQKADNPKGEKLSAWKTILAVGAVGLGLLFVGIVLRLRSKKSSDVDPHMKDRIPSPPRACEDSGCDSVGHPSKLLAGNQEETLLDKAITRDEMGYTTV